MQWLAAAAAYRDAVPLGGPAEGIAGYLLGYGPVGVVALVLAWALYKGLFVLARTAEKDRAEAVAAARADLLRENGRLVAEKEKAEEQRDEALKIAQTQLVPLVVSFVATSEAMLPLLRDVVAMREDLRRSAGR